METRVGTNVIEALAQDADVYLSPNFYSFSPLRFLVYGAVRSQMATILYITPLFSWFDLKWISRFPQLAIAHSYCLISIMKRYFNM